MATSRLVVFWYCCGAASSCYLIYDLFLHMSWSRVTALAVLALSGVHYYHNVIHSSSKSMAITAESSAATVKSEQSADLPVEKKKDTWKTKEKPLRMNQTQLNILNLDDPSDTTTYYPNSDAPIPFENDFFKGRFLFMLKTPEPHKWSHMFSGKR